MTTNPTAPSPPDAVERVIEFLSQCGESDIEAGIGALFGHGSDERILKFRTGIAAAIAAHPAPSAALDPATVEACAKELDECAYPHAAAAIRALIPKAMK